MDRDIDLRAQVRAVPGRTAGERSRASGAGVRRLFELPVEPVGDCTVRIQASTAGRCAACSSAYPAGDWIGHSRDAAGWVASCCL